jgi:hypothetical protein
MGRSHAPGKSARAFGPGLWLWACAFLLVACGVKGKPEPPIPDTPQKSDEMERGRPSPRPFRSAIPASPVPSR